MADSKITALTAITTVNPATYPLVIVDTSDTSMAITGTTKKVTTNQLLGSGGTATLASATITGDLTVRTNKLVVTSTGVGVGTASPLGAFHLVTAAAGYSDAGYFENSQAAAANVGPRLSLLGVGSIAMATIDAGWNAAANTDSYLRFLTRGTSSVQERYRIASDGVATWSNVGGVAGTAMTLNSTGLGVGVSPSAGKGCLQLSSGINFPATQVASSDPNTLDDYVEGTFTPVIQGVSTAGTGVYTVQSGRYTKIGNRVFVDIFLNWTAHTGTGAMLIANLPFTIKNASNYYPSVTFGQLNNIALAANSVLTGYGTFNTKTLNLDQYPVGGGATSSVQMDPSGSIVCSVCYEV